MVQYPVFQTPVYWSLQQTEFPPALYIARPKTSTQVVDILEAIISNDCPFAVTGSGHSPGKGTSTVASGTLIDLKEMLGLNSNDPDFETVAVGAGYK